MDGKQVFILGLGLQSPRKLVGQNLDTLTKPSVLTLNVAADRGSLYLCACCGKPCPAHDFKALTWRHLIFFQHHCFITAQAPRTKCEKHGVHRINVPWARGGSKFTLLFEQALLMLAREMPVKACAEYVGVRVKRIWRVIQHYIGRVGRALLQMDLSELKVIGLDETASKRGHNYVTVFIDMDRSDKPVVFTTPGKETVKQFKTFLEGHEGKAENILEVVCDMSPAFLAAAKEELTEANVTIDWFHVVQLFTKALDDVRKAECKLRHMPKELRWAILKNADGPLTEKQIAALAELETSDLHTATAWYIKEKLRWIRKAETSNAARWRLSNFINYARNKLGYVDILEPVRVKLWKPWSATQKRYWNAGIQPTQMLAWKD